MKKLFRNLWWRWRRRGSGIIKLNEIYPDRIIQAIHWHDHLIVICDHSVYIISEDCGVITSRLLRH